MSDPNESFPVSTTAPVSSPVFHLWMRKKQHMCTKEEKQVHYTTGRNKFMLHCFQNEQAY